MNKVAASLVLALALQLGAVAAYNETSSNSEKDFQQVQIAGKTLLNMQSQIKSDVTEIKEQLQASNELKGEEAKKFLLKESENITHAEPLLLQNFNIILSIETKYLLKAIVACGNDCATKESLVESLLTLQRLKLLFNQAWDNLMMTDHVIEGKEEVSTGPDVKDDMQPLIDNIETQQKTSQIIIELLDEIMSANSNITQQLQSCEQPEAKEALQLIQIVNNIIGPQSKGEREIYAIVAKILNLLLASSQSETERDLQQIQAIKTKVNGLIDQTGSNLAEILQKSEAGNETTKGECAKELLVQDFSNIVDARIPFPDLFDKLISIGIKYIKKYQATLMTVKDLALKTSLTKTILILKKARVLYRKITDTSIEIQMEMIKKSQASKGSNVGEDLKPLQDNFEEQQDLRIERLHLINRTKSYISTMMEKLQNDTKPEAEATSKIFQATQEFFDSVYNQITGNYAVVSNILSKIKTSSKSEDFQEVQTAGNVIRHLQSEVISDANELKEQLQATNELKGEDAKKFLIKNLFNSTDTEPTLVVEFNKIVSIQSKYLLKAALVCGKKSLIESLLGLLRLQLLFNKALKDSIFYENEMDAKILVSTGKNVSDDMKPLINNFEAVHNLTNIRIEILDELISLISNITQQLQSCDQPDAKTLMQLNSIIVNDIFGPHRTAASEISLADAESLKALHNLTLQDPQRSNTTTSTGFSLAVGAGVGINTGGNSTGGISLGDIGGIGIGGIGIGGAGGIGIGPGPVLGIGGGLGGKSSSGGKSALPLGLGK